MCSNAKMQMRKKSASYVRLWIGHHDQWKTHREHGWQSEVDIIHFLIGGAWGIFKVKGDGLLWLERVLDGMKREKSKQEKKENDAW